MIEKKAGRVIILIALGIICLANLIWFLGKNHFDTENKENRELATKPSLTVENYRSFFDEYTSYFNDNLPFRSKLVTLNTAIDYFGFKRSSNDKVIIGDDNWLFYSGTSDGDPVACYQGTNLFSEEELARLAQNCIEQRDFLLEQGKEFVIFIAPNKERMFSEYMPSRYGEPAECYRALQIYNFLKQNTDLRVLYPYDELMTAKESLKENIWYKTDTHWNFIGGYVGATVLLTELGIEMPSIYSSDITIVVGEEKSGDLAAMLNLSEQLKYADREYRIIGYDTHDFECIVEEPRGMWSFRSTNTNPRTIYVIRDSFVESMVDYIASQFPVSYLRHKRTYSYDDLLSCNPDIVVYETVERYAGDLLTFSIR